MLLKLNHFGCCNKIKKLIKPCLLLAIITPCLFESVLYQQSSFFHEFEVILFQAEWILLICLPVWLCVFLLLIFNLKDLPLVGLLFIAIAAYFIGYAYSSSSSVMMLVVGVTIGKATHALLNKDGQIKNNRKKKDTRKVISRNGNRQSAISNFLVGLIILLASSSWWHLDMSDNFYDGSRWMGLWDNPNDYGLLMSAGLVLTIGLLIKGRMKRGGESNFESHNTDNRKWNIISDSKCCLLTFLLTIAAGMMAVGLVFSYSRGAWLGTTIGLLYLAKAHSRFKWQIILPVFFIVASAVYLFWNATLDSMPWYVKRLDFGRPSAQHRVVAWRAGFEIMWDYPFGVGWNKTIETYQKKYFPPDDSAVAITTNDYLMLGTQLGMPGLFCFLAYIGLCLKTARRASLSSEDCNLLPQTGAAKIAASLHAACRASALAMLTAFWFDSGLFKLPTAVVFWILLELGVEENSKKEDQFKSSAT